MTLALEVASSCCLVSTAGAELCMARMGVVVRSEVGHLAFAGLAVELKFAGTVPVACWVDYSGAYFGCFGHQLPYLVAHSVH